MKGDDKRRTGGKKRSRSLTGRGLLIAACLVASLAAFLSGLFDIQNFDVWWHLKTGELIVTEGSIPDTDPFSYTAYGRPWVTHEWLSEVIFHLIDANLGAAGLIYLKAALLAVSVGLVLSLTLRRRESVTVLLLFPFFLFPIALRPFVRPHIFTLFFTSVLLLLLYRYREDGNRKALYIIPPVFLLWANLHSGVTLGLIILTTFALGSLAARRLSRQRPAPGRGMRFRPLAMTLVASFLASLVNPNHLEALIYPFLLARNPLFTRTIAELKGPLSPEYSMAFWQIGFFATIAITAAVACFTRRHTDLASIFPLLIYLSLSFFAHRNIPTFALIALAYCCVSLTAKMKPAKPASGKAGRRALIPRTAGPVFSVIVPGLTVLLLLVKGTYMGDGEWRTLGTGIEEENYPIGAYEFLEEAGLDGNMVNKMAFGGYLIYRGFPRRKVFIDGRLLLYGDNYSRTYLNAYYGSIGVEELTGRYDTDYFLLDYPKEDEPRMIQYYLSRSPDWKLVYWDDNSLVYVKNDSTHSSIIERYAYEGVDPIYRKGQLVSRQVEKNPEMFIEEVERQLAMRPETAISRVFLGTAYEKTGRLKEAIAEFERVLRKDPGRKDLQNKLFMLRMREESSGVERQESSTESAPSALARGLRFLSQGQNEKARDALLKATREAPDDANAHYNLAIAYRNLGERNLARKSLERAISVNPSHTDAYNDLGIIYGLEGRYETAIGYFEAALKVDPKKVSVLYNFAKIYEMAGEREKAREKLREILEIDPDHKKAARMLEKLSREPRPDPAGD